MVVSLGVDTFEKDPISQFTLGTDCFPRIGEALAGINRPVLFVMEGGYAIEALGRNVAAFLSIWLPPA